MIVLDEKTRIPLFTVITIVPVIVISTLWIGTVSGRVTANEQRTDRVVDKIMRMENREDSLRDKLTDIRESLARIEERLRIAAVK